MLTKQGGTVRRAIASLAVLWTVADGSSARAHQDPPGCTAPAVFIILRALRADGVVPISTVESVSPCETILFVASLLSADDPTRCAVEGGRLSVQAPDGALREVPGPIPCLGGTGSSGEPCMFDVVSFTSGMLPYQVRPQDIANGQLTASATWSGGIAHTAEPDTSAPFIGTGFVTRIELCRPPDPDVPCVVFACDPNATDLLVTGQQGLCSDQPDQLAYLPAGTACLDTDGDPCTVAHCDGAGTCVQGDRSCDDGDPCTADSCKSTGCQHTRIPDCHVCGDGVVDFGEQCDLGRQRNGAAGSCCDATCLLKDATFVCARASSECQRDAICERSADGTCPPNELAPADRKCDDGDLCTTGDHCQAGSCVGGNRICDARTAFKRLPGAVPRIVVDCRGVPFMPTASCEAEGVLDEARGLVLPRIAPVGTSAQNACAAEANGRVTITRKRRRALRRGAASIAMPLNACGRKLYNGLGPGQHMPASVSVALGDVTTADPKRHDVSLRRVVDIARGGGR